MSAATLAAGLIAAPGAFAAGAAKPTVAEPKAAPTPGFASTGVAGDACDTSTVPGWLGLTTGGPTLTAVVGTGTDTATPVGARFTVRDVTGAETGKAFQGDTVPGSPGTASIQASGLADGHSYAWNAKAVQGERHSKPTADCHFRLDLTPPTAAVNSTDFPASGSGAQPVKYAGQSGTFTITGTDPVPASGAASGVACYQYALAPAALSVGKHCGDPGTVAAAADGGAAVQVKPADWGTNVLAVQAVDDAGNVSQPFSYSFYAPSNPNPPQALGDIDNDGVPDILLPDAAGNLLVISTASGSTAPTATVPAAAAPGGNGWTAVELSHRGWGSNGAPADTVFARNLAGAGTRGSLYVYGNQGAPAIEQGSPTLARAPRSCVDTTGLAITCPADIGFAGADQLVALGPVSAVGGPFAPSLLGVEHGDLWLFAGGDFGFGRESARRLTATGTWTGYDLVAPGPDGSGNLALWARDRATGQLHAYAIPKQADGTFDFTALADPAAGAVADGFTVETYPKLGSSGDGNADGAPDLWAVTADRHLVTFTGYTAPKDLGVLG